MRGAEIARHTGRIEAALAEGAAARSALVASWSRSARLHGLDAARPLKPARLTEAEFRAARDRMGPLVAAAAPILDGLFRAVGGVGCCVLLADRDGVPLERRGSRGDDPAFADWGLWTGALWSEAAQGTNGIGTCLAEGRAVTIHRDQHFLARNTALSCMTAPIFDHDGSLAGALDVSSAMPEVTEAVAALIAHSVAESARRIEAEAFRLAFPKARFLLVPGAEGNAAALLAVDGDDLVIGASRVARQVLGITGDLAAAPRPVADLPAIRTTATGATPPPETPPETLADGERAVMMRALARAGGNVSAAARALGISRATLHRKLAARRGQ
ncbi:MAG: Fis family transcriptional regulator [Alphaproteobacteria bacterium HGW-Alphaproteobacteria-6]|nr:MAG: Fis family transcriptional regulator [Alphaproteobacteria bacterium HGW-Alphaproteobacteria-6]